MVVSSLRELFAFDVLPDDAMLPPFSGFAMLCGSTETSAFGAVSACAASASAPLVEDGVDIGVDFESSCGGNSNGTYHAQNH